MHKHQRVGEPADQRQERPAPLAGITRPRKRWVVLPIIASAGLALAASVMPPGSNEPQPRALPLSSTLSAGATPDSSPVDDLAAATSGAGPVEDPAGVTPNSAGDIAGAVAASSQPVRLSFAAAGIDVAILPLTPTDADLASQSLVPPLTLDAYWLTPYGFPGPGSVNTTYIAGHSWEGRDAPFNRLSNEALIGSEFTLATGTGDITYVVDSVITHDKDTLKNSSIWDIVPGRVVLISCYTEDPWGKNVVVSATPKTT
jgi:hypothetical protein